MCEPNFTQWQTSPALGAPEIKAGESDERALAAAPSAQHRPALHRGARPKMHENGRLPCTLAVPLERD